MPPKGGTGGRPTLPPSQGLPPIILKPVRAPVRPAAKSVVHSVTGLFGGPQKAPVRSAPRPTVNLRQPLSAGNAFKGITHPAPTPQHQMAQVRQQVIGRVGLPQGGPFQQIVNDQMSKAGPPRVVPSAHLPFSAPFTPFTTLPGTPGKITTDMRTLIDTAKSSPDSIPKTVGQQLSKLGYLTPYSQSFTHKAFGFGGHGYWSGPADPQGMKADLPKRQQAMSVIPLAGGNSLGAKWYDQLVEFPQQAGPATLDLINNAAWALQGKTGPLEQNLKDLAATAKDPIGNAPTIALMALTGADAVGRVGGGIARSGALGENLAKAASLQREPVTVIPQTADTPGVLFKQTYSPSLLGKGAQVLKEHVLGPPSSDRLLTGGVAGGTLTRPGLVHTHANMAEGIRRFAGLRAIQYAHDLPDQMGVPKGAEHAIPLAVERTLRGPSTLMEDLGKRLDMLRSESHNLKGADLRLNHRAQRQVQSLVDHQGLHANPQSVFNAANAWTQWHQPLENMLAQIGHIDPGQLNAKYVPYAISHMGAKYDPATDGFTVNGKSLPLASIKADMQAHGVPEPGFLTHRDNNTFGSAIRSRQSYRPGGGYQMRTGANYRKGTYEMRWPAVGLQGYRSANLIAAHQNYNRLINRFAVGSGDSAKAARVKAGQFEFSPEGEQVKGLGPVTTVPVGNAKVRSRSLFNLPQTEDVLRGLGLEPHWDHIPEDVNQATHALIPSKVLHAIDQHDQISRQNFGKGLQWYTNKWRSAQLYTSPRWLVGNPQEHAIRLAFANVNPLGVFGRGSHVKIGKTAVDEFRRVAADPNATPEARDIANQHIANIDAGTHYGSQAMNTIRTDLSRAFEQSGPMGHLARFGDWLQNDSYAAKPVKGTISGWNRWKSFVGAGMKAVERNSKLASYGKVAHDELRGFTGSWSGLLTRQDELVKQWAQGKLDPNDAAQLGHRVLRMMGNWSQLTPGVRHAVQTYMPFGLWWLNSLKFVFDVLPRDHPMKTALLVAMEHATTTQRAAQGQGYDPHTGQLLGPDYLQGSPAVTLPLLGRVGVGSEYYSPFGVGITPLNTASDMIFPQLMDPAMTLRGIDPLTGQPLENTKTKQAPTDPTRLIRAAASSVTGAIPGARQAIQLATRGGKPDVTSPLPWAIVPGSQKGLAPTVMKTLFPLKTTAISTSTKAKKGGFNPFGGGGGGFNPFGSGSGSYSP